MTGFAILVTGQWTSGLTGAAMTSAAFETSLPGIGGIAVTICLTFFAFTTALGWCVYGERCAIYFFGDKAQIPSGSSTASPSRWACSRSLMWCGCLRTLATRSWPSRT